MSKFWSPLVHDLVPYVPGEQPNLAAMVKLNTNENPYGPSPKVLAAMQSAMGDGLRLYPDPEARLLKESIARYYAIESTQVFVGNGSDEVLAHVFQAFFQQAKPILFPDISYSFYAVYCQLYDIHFEQIPLDAAFQIISSDYQKPNGGIIFANPNAPTGCLLSLMEIESFLLDHPDSVTVVDEAYIDFGGTSAVSLINRYANLLVVQTLSKSRSLAGMRVGLAMGHVDLITGLERVKNSFNSYPLDRIAIVGAAAAFEDDAYFKQTCRQIIEERIALTSALEDLGFRVLPSAANFVFAQHPQQDAHTLAEQLKQRAIFVRHFKKSRIDQYLRITVGSNDQNKILISALKELL